MQRTDQIRRLAVGADLAPGLVSGDAWKKINELPTVKNLPEGVQKLELGDSKWQAELVYYFMIALMSGVLLVFAVLVLLYRRFLSPLVNMGSLLLAPLGAAIGLHLTGNPVSLPVLIGILMLFGIVAKNSILLVDFAVEMMDHGMDKDEAIHEAEYAYLKDVATIFAFSESDFERIAARHVRRADDPYLILKADRSMSDEGLKRHYRRLVAENHPDREIARGLPPEAVKIATERVAAINAAWERIAAERNLR